MRTLLLAALAPLLIGLLGCSTAKGVPLDATVPVQGTVQLDGKPLAEGEITFAVDGKPPQIAAITQGAYSGKAIPGANRVEVAVYRTETDPMTGEPMKVNTLPPRYSFQSKLTAQVADSGANQFDFQVQSK